MTKQTMGQLVIAEKLYRSVF